MRHNDLFKHGLTLLTASAAVAGAAAAETLAPPDYRPWTVGIEAGTDGIFGGDLWWRFCDHLGARVGADYGWGDWDHVGIAGIDYHAKLQLLSEPLTLDLYPWKTHSFHVSVGALLNQNEVTGGADRSGTLTIDGHPLPLRRDGELSMKIQQQPVNPYLSIGGNFFYFDSAHHWAVGGELGVAYTGEADVSQTWTGVHDRVTAAALHLAKRHLEDYAGQFEWWPVAKLSLSYSF